MFRLFRQCLGLCRWSLLPDHRSFASSASLLLLPGLMVASQAHKEIGQSIGEVAHSSQQPAGASDAAKDEQDIRVLEPGKPVERKLAGGQTLNRPGNPGDKLA